MNQEEYPDSLGFCYNQLCEYLVSAIVNGDFELFYAAYKSFFEVAFMYHEYIRQDVMKIKAPHQQVSVFRAFTAPLVEYAIISGLAILWGEFTEEKQWRELVDTELSSFMSKDDNNRDILTYIIQKLSLRKNTRIAIGSRDALQTNWEQRVIHSICDNGFYHYNYDDLRCEVLKNESALLKAFCYPSRDTFRFTAGVEEVYLILCCNQYVSCDQQYKSSFNWEDKLYEADAP